MGGALAGMCLPGPARRAHRLVYVAAVVSSPLMLYPGCRCPLRRTGTMLFPEAELDRLLTGTLGRCRPWDDGLPGELCPVVHRHAAGWL